MKSKFYEKLNEIEKENFDETDRVNPHTEKFLKLMDNPDNKEYPYFTDDNLEYICKEDLPTVSAVYPDDAARYMDW